jgi:hypothetical protein
MRTRNIGIAAIAVLLALVAGVVSELIEARDEKHLLRFQKLLASYELLIVY